MIKKILMCIIVLIYIIGLIKCYDDEEDLLCCTYVNSSAEEKYQLCKVCSTVFTNETTVCPVITICKYSDKDFGQFLLIDEEFINNCTECR